MHYFKMSKDAGERNVDSLTGNDYQVVRQEGNGTLLTGAAPIIIGGGAVNDTQLDKIIIHTALVGTVTIAGFLDSDDVPASYILPIGLAAGVYDFGGVKNAAGALTFTLSSPTDYDRVMVKWTAA